MNPSIISQLEKKLEQDCPLFFGNEMLARNSMIYFSHFYPDLMFVTLTNTWAIFPSFESLFFFYYNLVREHPSPLIRGTVKSDINILLEAILSLLNSAE